jgi:hypothetical protein
MRRAGTPRRSVSAFSMAIAIADGECVDEGGSIEVTEGSSLALELVENNTEGNVKSMATATDKADRILNERILEGLAVVIGCVVLLKAAYSGSVEDEVNTKAMVAGDSG